LLVQLHSLSHPLPYTTLFRSLSGGVNLRVADFTGDGSPDFAVNLSQQWEEVHLLANDGRGNFAHRILFGSTNDDFAMSNLAAGEDRKSTRLNSSHVKISYAVI